MLNCYYKETFAPNLLKETHDILVSYEDFCAGTAKKDYDINLGLQISVDVKEHSISQIVAIKERDKVGTMAKPRKEIKTQTLKQRHNWYLIRIVLGAYLIYLAWQLGTGIFSGNAKDDIILLGIAAGIFGLFGVGLIILNIRLLRADRTSDNEETPPEDKTE